MLTLSKIFPESVLLNGFFYTLSWPLVAHWILWQSEMQAACWMPAWLWLFQRSPVLGDGPSLLLLASCQLAGAVVTAVRVTGCEMCCCDSGDRSLYQWSLSTLFFPFLFTRKSRGRNKLLKGHLPYLCSCLSVTDRGYILLVQDGFHIKLDAWMQILSLNCHISEAQLIVVSSIKYLIFNVKLWGLICGFCPSQQVRKSSLTWTSKACALRVLI